MTRLEELILRTLAIVLTPVVAGLVLYVNFLWKDNEDSKPEFNGYVAPRQLEPLVDYAKSVTVTINCKGQLGSGFSFEIDANFDFAEWNFEVPKSNRSIILTNHHVIEDCIDDIDSLELILAKGEKKQAVIASVDVENDLAALLLDKKLDWVVSTPYEMRSGYWVMAVGSPFAMEGTVTFGNIIQMEKPRIFTSASLNRGNSGGPLLDNEGYVVGVNAGYRAVAQNLNWAIDISQICRKLATCEFGELGKGPS